MIVVSSIAATLFFGGWTLGALNGILGVPFVWYMVKVGIGLFIFMWMRATLPRIRYDQLMRLGWQVLLPLAVLNLLFTALVIALGWPWWVSGLFGLAVIVIGAVIFYTRVRRGEYMPGGPTVKAVMGMGISGLNLPTSVRLVHFDTPSDSGKNGNATPSLDGAQQPIEVGKK
jgi:NADH-quinone oxidoreductase subunit H